MLIGLLMIVNGEAGRTKAEKIASVDHEDDESPMLELVDRSEELRHE